MPVLLEIRQAYKGLRQKFQHYHIIDLFYIPEFQSAQEAAGAGFETLVRISQQSAKNVHPKLQLIHLINIRHLSSNSFSEYSIDTGVHGTVFIW